MSNRISEPELWEGIDPEVTIIRLPGGRERPRVEAKVPEPAWRPRETLLPPLREVSQPDLHNPLLSAACPLFMLLPKLRCSTGHRDPVGLRTQLLQYMRDFEQCARGHGVSHESTRTARYALCSLLDEAVLSTPWGHASVWNTQGLLVTLHQEVFGGEKFFQLLHRLLPDPGGNRNLLELIYACLAFGFQGRYRLLHNGAEQLDQLRLRLGEALQRVHGPSEPELSPNWRGSRAPQAPLPGNRALWSALVGLAGLLLVGFWYLRTSLDTRAELQLQALRGLHSENLVRTPVQAVNTASAAPVTPVTPVTPVPATAPVPSPARPELSGFLSPEVAAGLLTVEDTPARSTIRISGDNLFASGSASLNSRYQPVLLRIAEALNGVPGRVLVTGHTDDRPIRSFRYPSNWDLSIARAQAVLQTLSRTLRAPERLSFEGRGESAPVVPNDSPSNRARNRRIEITLATGSGS